MISISTPRLLLRPWKVDDETELVRLANRREIWINLRDLFPHPYRIENAIRWIQESLSKSNETQQHFAIEKEGSLLGGIGLSRFADVYANTAEIGYWLGVEHWGKGYATEAVGALSDWGFQFWHLARIQAGVFAGNLASSRVLEKAGYRLEARHAKGVFKDGHFLDEWLFVRLRPESVEGL